MKDDHNVKLLFIEAPDKIFDPTYHQVCACMHWKHKNSTINITVNPTTQLYICLDGFSNMFELLWVLYKHISILSYKTSFVEQ